jgi:hypothetical protein
MGPRLMLGVGEGCEEESAVVKRRWLQKKMGQRAEKKSREVQSGHRRRWKILQQSRFTG